MPNFVYLVKTKTLGFHIKTRTTDQKWRDGKIHRKKKNFRMIKAIRKQEKRVLPAYKQESCDIERKRKGKRNCLLRKYKMRAVVGKKNT